MEGDVCVSTTATGGSFISTHALTWRATETAAAVPAPPGISTHALTWRATSRSARALAANGGDFYPRPHMEGDALSTG